MMGLLHIYIDGLEQEITERNRRIYELEAEKERLREALIETYMETLENAMQIGGFVEGDYWQHSCMSDGRWFEQELGLPQNGRHRVSDLGDLIEKAADRYVDRVQKGGE